MTCLHVYFAPLIPSKILVVFDMSFLWQSEVQSSLKVYFCYLNPAVIRNMWIFCFKIIHWEVIASHLKLPLETKPKLEIRYCLKLFVVLIKNLLKRSDSGNLQGAKQKGTIVLRLFMFAVSQSWDKKSGAFQPSYCTKNKASALMYFCFLNECLLSYSFFLLFQMNYLIVQSIT